MFNMNEYWVNLKDFENVYEVSNLGNIRSVDRIVVSGNKVYMRKGKQLKPAFNKKGYLTVMLSNKGKNYTFILHRLIAKSFIENPYNLPQVNHINGIKNDNRICNLEWCTNSYNMNHAINMGLFVKNKRRKSIIIYNDLISVSFPKIKLAADFLKTTSGAIGNVLNKSRNSIKGFKADYI